MEEEAPSRRSVAELAGRFKGSAAPHDAAGQETAKPVRRRPPRSLQLPKPPGDDQEQPAGVTSPLPTKAKRNSALIEKLQANLALSPSALLPSPKSPGFRLLPPAFPPASPGSGPVTVGTSPSSGTPTSPFAASPLTEQEGPASFEAPPTVEEGSILSNANVKGRARLSIRRRPPSRRHRKSSSGDEVGVASEGGDTSLKSPTEPEDKTRGGDGGEKEERGEDQTDEGKDDKTDEVKDDKTDEVKDDKTDEVKDDKTDEVKDDKTDEAKDKTDEVKDDKTDEVKDDKTDEVKDDKTDEAKDDKTDEAKDDKTDPSSCPEKNESEDHSETSVEPGQEVEKKKEEENRPEGGKEEDGSSSGEKEEKKSSEEKQEDLTEEATNTDVTEEEKAEETTGQSSVR